MQSRFAIRHGLDYDDLLGAAYEGLCKAALGFEPRCGHRPSSDVVPKVRGELLHQRPRSRARTPEPTAWLPKERAAQPPRPRERGKARHHPPHRAQHGRRRTVRCASAYRSRALRRLLSRGHKGQWQAAAVSGSAFWRQRFYRH